MSINENRLNLYKHLEVNKKIFGKPLIFDAAIHGHSRGHQVHE